MKVKNNLFTQRDSKVKDNKKENNYSSDDLFDCLNVRSREEYKKFKNFLPKMVEDNFEVFYEEVLKNLNSLQSLSPQEEKIENIHKYRKLKNFFVKEKLFIKNLFINAFVCCVKALNKDELLENNINLQISLNCVYEMIKDKNFKEVIRYLCEVYFSHEEKCKCKLCTLVTKLLLNNEKDLIRKE